MNYVCVRLCPQYNNYVLGELVIKVDCIHVDTEVPPKDASHSTSHSRYENDMSKYSHNKNHSQAPKGSFSLDENEIHFGHRQDTESSMSILSNTKNTEESFFINQIQPHHFISKKELHNFIISKLFYRLLDDLDCQDGVENTHPLVEQLQSEGCFILTHVNREMGRLHVLCPDQHSCEHMYQLFTSGKLSQILNECLISSDIIQGLGMIHVEVVANINRKVYDRCRKELYVPTRVAYR